MASETVSLRITLRYKDVEEFSDRFAENVSSAGMFLRTRSPKPTGTKVRFELLLADGNKVLRGEGVVVSVRHDDRPGMALRFNALDPESQEVVERLVAKHGEGDLAPTPLSTPFRRGSSVAKGPGFGSSSFGGGRAWSRTKTGSFASGGGVLPRSGAWAGRGSQPPAPAESPGRRRAASRPWSRSDSTAQPTERIDLPDGDASTTREAGPESSADLHPAESESQTQRISFAPSTAEPELRAPEPPAAEPPPPDPHPEPAAAELPAEVSEEQPTEALSASPLPPQESPPSEPAPRDTIAADAAELSRDTIAASALEASRDTFAAPDRDAEADAEVPLADASSQPVAATSLETAEAVAESLVEASEDPESAVSESESAVSESELSDDAPMEIQSLAEAAADESYSFAGSESEETLADAPDEMDIVGRPSSDVEEQPFAGELQSPAEAAQSIAPPEGGLEPPEADAELDDLVGQVQTLAESLSEEISAQAPAPVEGEDTEDVAALEAETLADVGAEPAQLRPSLTRDLAPPDTVPPSRGTEDSSEAAESGPTDASDDEAAPSDEDSGPDTVPPEARDREAALSVAPEGPQPTADLAHISSAIEFGETGDTPLVVPVGSEQLRAEALGPSDGPEESADSQLATQIAVPAEPVSAESDVADDVEPETPEEEVRAADAQATDDVSRDEEPSDADESSNPEEHRTSLADAFPAAEDYVPGERSSFPTPPELEQLRDVRPSTGDLMPPDAPERPYDPSRTPALEYAALTSPRGQGPQLSVTPVQQPVAHTLDPPEPPLDFLGGKQDDDQSSEEPAAAETPVAEQETPAQMPSLALAESENDDATERVDVRAHGVESGDAVLPSKTPPVETALEQYVDSFRPPELGQPVEEVSEASSELEPPPDNWAAGFEASDQVASQDLPPQNSDAEAPKTERVDTSGVRPIENAEAEAVAAPEAAPESADGSPAADAPAADAPASESPSEASPSDEVRTEAEGAEEASSAEVRPDEDAAPELAPLHADQAGASGDDVVIETPAPDLSQVAVEPPRLEPEAPFQAIERSSSSGITRGAEQVIEAFVSTPMRASDEAATEPAIGLSGASPSPEVRVGPAASVSVTGVGEPNVSETGEHLPQSVRPNAPSGARRPAVEREPNSAAQRKDARTGDLAPPPDDERDTGDVRVAPARASVPAKVSVTARRPSVGPGSAPWSEEPLNPDLQGKPIVGIDLGGRWARLAMLTEGRFQSLQIGGQSRLFAYAGVREDGSLAVGAEARSLSLSHPDRAFSIRRLLIAVTKTGVDPEQRGFLPSVSAADDGGVSVHIGDHDVPIVDVVAAFLEPIKSRIEAAVGSRAARVMITVPHRLDEAARDVIREACRRVGVELVHLVSEPTVALLPYDLDPKPIDSVLIVDLASTDLGISLARRGRLGFGVVKSHWDPRISARLLDEEVVRIVLKELEAQHGESYYNSPVVRERLFDAVERIRELDSREPTTELRVLLPGPDGDADIERTLTLQTSKVIDASERFVSEIMTQVGQMLADAGVHPRALGSLVLAGAASKFPALVRELIAQTQKKPLEDVPGLEARARGLAVLAGRSLTEERTDRPEQLSLPVGLGLPGGRFRPLVRTTEQLPVRISRKHATTRDAQTEMELMFYQGTQDQVGDNTFLGSLALTGLPKSDRGNVQVEVDVSVDQDAVLVVTLSEDTSGRKARLTVPTQDTPNGRRQEILSQPSVVDLSDPAKAKAKKKGLLGRFLGR